jgi:hypothetical protein
MSGFPGNASRGMAAAVALSVLVTAGCAKRSLDPAEARAIAKEAYVYGFPMVDGYRIMYAYYVDTAGPEFKARWNQIRNIPRVFTPEDKAVQTPNSDTPYSMVGLDLRTEPIVLTVPAIEEGRYFSVQLVDLYTHNFAYLGSRTTGNGGGNFMVAGPGWTGETPAGIASVVHAETDLALAIYRTQLFNPADLDNVKRIQEGYKVQPLSAFLGQPAPAAAPQIDFMRPLGPQDQKTSLEFFNELNFVLQFCPVDASEQELRARFARLGIEGGRRFDPASLSPEVRSAMEAGMADAWQDFAALKGRVDAREVSTGEMFGTRAFLKNNYLYRMTAAVLGIYGNSRDEALYPGYGIDADGNPLDGSHRYRLRFDPGQLPPVNAFWSLTMYEMPSSLLSANRLNRYLINSPMLPQFKHDPDGGLTLYIQHESPGKEWEANWLPAPSGPFNMVLRLYWPKAEVVEGKWTPPPLKRAS